MQRIISILVVMLLASRGAGIDALTQTASDINAGSSATAPAGPAGSGLYVQDGVLMLRGRPYRGVGINYYSAFTRALTEPADTSYRQGLAALQAAGVPFIRFSLNGFWPADWKLYMVDRKEYFHRLDALVGEAERLGIGLIPSFFWQHGAVPDVVGESVDQWGNADSKTYTVMREYVRAVVDRYRLSPAIWGWEFGNEFRLHVDLPDPARGFPHVAPKAGTPTTRTANDILRRSAVERAQAEFARLVRQIDRHRILVTGDSRPRSCAHHLHTEGAWKRDTPTQWKAMLLGDNADPYDTISIHCYPLADEAYFEPSVSLTGLLGVCQDAARSVGKPLFVGEFGASGELGADRARQYVDEMLAAIVALRIPLAALWVYDLPSQDGSYNITPDNDRAWMLEAIRRTNQRLQADAPVATLPASD